MMEVPKEEEEKEKEKEKDKKVVVDKKAGGGEAVAPAKKPKKGE